MNSIQQNSKHKHESLSKLYIPFDLNYIFIDDKPDNINYQSGDMGNDLTVSNVFDMDFFIRNKEEIVKSKIKLIYDEIKTRYYLKLQNIYRINVDQCACNNLIFTMGEEIFDKIRMDLERKILDLEQEKRREETTFFRDISFLNKDLRDSLIEKLEENQKASLMLNQGEKLPCNT